jgi:hypothetical protein
MLRAPEYPPIHYDDRPPVALAATREELYREHEKKKGEFNTAFASLLHREIFPTLLQFLEKVRSQGHHLELDTVASHSAADQYQQQSFSVRLKDRPEPVVFTFTGNYDHRKVFIYTEFNKSTLFRVYDLSMINEPLLERIILKGLENMVAS